MPWVSTIGNHERDSPNYFSYMALPGNKHYFGFDYANAHIVCLDSNAWIEKGRDSEQFRWVMDDLRRRRDSTWTFVAFHHPLFGVIPSVPSIRWCMGLGRFVPESREPRGWRPDRHDRFTRQLAWAGWPKSRKRRPVPDQRRSGRSSTTGPRPGDGRGRREVDPSLTLLNSTATRSPSLPSTSQARSSTAMC